MNSPTTSVARDNGYETADGYAVPVCPRMHNAHLKSTWPCRVREHGTLYNDGHFSWSVPLSLPLLLLGEARGLELREDLGLEIVGPQVAAGRRLEHISRAAGGRPT